MYILYCIKNCSSVFVLTGEGLKGQPIVCCMPVLHLTHTLIKGTLTEVFPV